MPLKKPTTPPAKPAPAKGKGKPAAKPARGGKKAAPPPEPFTLPPLFPGLSNERKIDLLGVMMALAGIFTLLSLASATHSPLTGGWIALIALAFGWGSYILPVGLILLGGWLVLRNIERIPAPSATRITGVILLYIYALTALHWVAASPQEAVEAAAAGTGGGYVGSLFLRMLYNLLGGPGTFFALIAWLLVGVALAFDVSIGEIFRRMGPVWRQAVRLWRLLMTRLARRPAETPAAPPSLEDGFTPLRRDPQPDSVAQSDAPPVAYTAGAPGGQVPWQLPNLKEILEPPTATSINEEYVEQRARLIEETLASFGAPAQVVETNRGPSVTQFGVEPLFIETRNGRTRVRVSKIVSLSDDLALALAAPRIRIQAPVPGRSYVGIEVPNDEMVRVGLRDIMETETYQRTKKPLSFALGRDVSGHPAVADLGSLPHLLIAGTTGSGKSVCVNSILTSLLLNNTPDDLRLILVDPKRVELTGYNGIPHLLAPVVVEVDRVIGALQWMTREMDKRYHEFAQVGARNIQDYNTRIKTQGGRKLPYLVIIIDELADLMMLAPDETERTITRLAQLARATGIHLILATQRPSVDVVTGLIKANFPARIAFAVASNTDSRVILDQPGAERLLGRGDMLFQSPEAPAPVRLQGVFVADTEIHRLVEFWRIQTGQVSAYAVPGSAPVDAPATSGVPLKQAPLFGEDITAPSQQGDPLLSESIDLVRREGRASVSMLQRKLRIGYTRAARIVDAMEEKGIVGPPEGATGVRQVLDYGPAAPPKEN